LPIADLAAGVVAAMAVCAALVRRGRSGDGDYLDVAMTDVLATWTGALPELRLEDGPALAGSVPGYGSFATADGGWVALGVIAEDHLWAALCDALGLGDAADLTFAERVERTPELNTRITSAVSAMSRADAVRLLEAAGVPVSPVLGQRELADDPHLLARGVVYRRPGGAAAMGHPVTYREHPADRPDAVPPLAKGAAALPQWWGPGQR
jgi:crotonobetainyl-CoA:carnitine CoA-transferase CaiB-like acyl-CoA transferase